MTRHEPEPTDVPSRPSALIHRLMEVIREVPVAWQEADARVSRWIVLGVETSGFEHAARHERASMVEVVDRFILRMRDAVPYLSEPVQRDLQRVKKLFEKSLEPREWWAPADNELLEKVEWLLHAAAEKWDRKERDTAKEERPQDAAETNGASLLGNRSNQIDASAGSQKLPQLKQHDREAWQTSIISGITQEDIAKLLNEKYGTTYTQGQVSRMIARAKIHAEASGLADKLPKPAERARPVDPAQLDIGARVDKRKPRPSDLARLDDDAD